MVASSPTEFSQGINSSLTDIYQALLLVVVFLSLLGNIIVLTALYTQITNSRNRMDIFVANLAVSDIVSSFAATLTLNNAKLHWNGGTAICKVCYYLVFVSFSVTVLTLCLASVDRFYGVCHACRHKQFLLLRNQGVAASLIWLISALLFAPYIYAYNVKEFVLFGGVTKQICTQTWSSVTEQAYFVLVVFVTLFCCPVVLFAYVFAKVLQKLRQPRSTSSGGNAILCKRRKQMTDMLMVVVVVHYISWTPAIFTNMAHTFGGTLRSYLNIWLICELVHFTRSTTYPLIYVLMYQNFRASLKDLFRSCSRAQLQPSTNTIVTKDPTPSSIIVSSDRSPSHLPENDMYTKM